MRYKTFALIIFFMAAAFSVFTADKKLRFAAAGARRESSSIFFDVSYNTFHIGRFEDAKERGGYISGSIGFSWLLPAKKINT